MYVYYKIKQLMVLVLLAGMTTLSSCEKDDDPNTGLVELLSFGPAGIQHGEKIQIIGNNLQLVTSVEMVGISIPQSEFTTQTSELIEFPVPDAASSGKIKLISSQGEIVSKATINFEVPVVITNIPAEARPGDEIVITGEYMNWVTEVVFADGKSVTDFVDSSLNELKLIVPVDAKTGRLVFKTSGTVPHEIESEEELIVTLPIAVSLAPNPVERGANLTITGTNLDLTRGILFKGITDAVTSFVSISETQLVVTVPESANQGKITLVAASGVQSESLEEMKLAGALPPLPPLGIAFYDDQMKNGWQKWGGWGGSANIDDNNNVRDGEKSIKVDYTGDWGGALQIGGGNSSTSGLTELSFAVWGEPGTGGKTLMVNVNGSLQKSFTIVESEWTEIHIPLSDFSSPANINEVSFQCQAWHGTLYIDHIGLR